MANNYFPALSTLISTDQIPENLTVITSGLTTLLDNVHFKDLQVQRSFDNAIRKMIAFNFTIEQWKDLMALSQSDFLEKFPQYISIESKSQLLDDDTSSFTTLTIGLIGYIIDGNTIKVNSVSTDINMITNGHF